MGIYGHIWARQASKFEEAFLYARAKAGSYTSRTPCETGKTGSHREHAVYRREKRRVKDITPVWAGEDREIQKAGPTYPCKDRNFQLHCPISAGKVTPLLPEKRETFSNQALCRSEMIVLANSPQRSMKMKGVSTTTPYMNRKKESVQQGYLL